MTVTAASHQGASRCFGFSSWEFSVSGLRLKRLPAGHFFVLHHVLPASVPPSGERAPWQRQDTPGPAASRCSLRAASFILFFIWLCWKKLDQILIFDQFSAAAISR